MDKKKVYVVTSGEYSDYGISAIFDDKLLAQKYIEIYNQFSDYNDYNNIEEYEINPIEQQLKQGRFLYEIEMYANGEVRGKDLSKNVDEKISFVVLRLNSETESWMTIHCYATDLTHAIKIANEKRVQYLATNRWAENAEIIDRRR